MFYRREVFGAVREPCYLSTANFMPYAYDFAHQSIQYQISRKHIHGESPQQFTGDSRPRAIFGLSPKNLAFSWLAPVHCPRDTRLTRSADSAGKNAQPTIAGAQEKRLFS